MDDKDKLLAKHERAIIKAGQQRRQASQRFEREHIPDDITRENYIEGYIRDLRKAYGSPRMETLQYPTLNG